MMLKQLPKGWKEIELKELIECVENGNRPKGGVGNLKEGIPSIGGEHINNKGGFNFSNVRFISKEFYNHQKRGIIQQGDVLVVKDGATTGRVTLVSEDNFPYKKALVNEHVFILRSKSSIITPKFLFYYLYGKNGQKQILENFHGSAQGGINTQFAKNVMVPFPSLLIQKQIVSILEKAEKLKQNRVEADKLTKEYLQSVFYEMFYNKGFEEVELGTVCEFNPKKAEINDIDENLEVSFVPMADVKEHEIYFDLNDTKKIKEIYTGYTYFKEDDVLLAKVTPCFENGKSGIAKNLKNGIGFGSSEFFVLRSSNKILSPLIYYIISSNKFVKAGKRQMAGTGGLKRLSKNYVTEYQIPLPPIELQRKFASIVEKVEKLKEKQKQSLEDIENLFNALMQKAFKGELIR